MSSGRYADALFFCHLTLECLLKKVFVIEHKKHPPKLHNLAYLETQVSLSASDEYKRYLKVITLFNMAGRYSDAKLDFYKKARKPYAEEWFTISNKVRLWLLKESKK